MKNKLHWRIILNYTLLIAWMVMIFLLSSEGKAVSTGRSDMIVETLQNFGVSGQTDLLTFIVRKSAHFIAYLVLGILAYNAFGIHKFKSRILFMLSSGLVILYAVSDEIHQLLVPGRSGEIRDVLIDSSAGIIGICLAHIVLRLRQHKSSAI